MKKLFVFMLVLLGSLTVMACDLESRPEDLSDQERVDEAAGRLNALFPTAGETQSNLTLPTEMIHGVQVSWESSNPEVIANDGTVTRPLAEEGNERVTLTATLTLNDAERVVELEFVVVHLPAGLAVYEDFAELHANSSAGDDIIARGIISAVFQAGYFIYDGENYISVYNPNHDVVSLGDRVEIMGQYARYHTLFQLGSITSESVIESNVEFEIDVEEKTVAEINELDSDADRLINGRTYRTSGLIELKGQYDNVYIVDGDDDLLVYYLSASESIAALEAYEGLIVELEVIYYTDHSADGVMVVFQGTEEDIELVELDYQDAFDTDVAAARATPNYTFGDDITLPEMGANGTAFTDWTSSHPDLIADDGTFVAMPAEPTEVTFTGTATIEDITGEVTVTVDALAMMAIEDAIDVEPDNHVMVEGIIYEIVDANRGFFIYDGTGYLYVRDFGLYPDLDYEVGDVVEFVGARDNYRGIPQITALKHHADSESTFDMPLNVGPVDIADIGAGVYPAGEQVTVTGVVEVIVGQFTDYRIYDGEDFIQIHHNSDNTVFGDFDGEIVTVEVTVFQWDFSTPFVTFFGTADDVEVGEMTDQMRAELAAAELDLGDLDLVTEDLVLPETGAYESTITWESHNHDALLDDGTVIRGTEDVTVTLTATVTVGEATAMRDFHVTVMNEDYVPEGATVAETLLVEDGETVVVEGVVTSYRAFGGSAGFFVQDDDGTGIFIADDLDVAIGNKVIIRGVMDTYDDHGNFRREVTEALLLDNDGGDHPITIIDDMTANEIVNAHPETQSMVFYLEDLEVVNIAFNQFYFETGEDMKIIFDYRNYGQHYVDILEVGDVIPWMVFTVSDIHFGDIRGEGVVLPELTAELVETIAENDIDLPAETTEDLNLWEELSIAGVDYDRGADVFPITWTSSDESVIALDGSVTQPAIGEDDVDVTLTAQIEFDAETTIELVFVVTVLAEVEEVPGEEVYTTDFGFVDSTSNSYSTSIQHTDDNGFEWDLLGRPGGAEGFMLGNASDGSYIEVQANTGVSSVTIDIVRAFTNSNARSVELFVNDVSVGTFDVDVDSNDPQTFVVENIDIEGNVTIRLESTSPGSRGAMDVLTFSWEGYEED